MIESQSDLDTLCRTLKTESVFAIDTEFVRESTYYAKLCLIQIATHKHLACIDCIANLDLKEFFDVILDDSATLIAHSGRQDIELIRQVAGSGPTRVFDTQIAAGLLGYPPQIGLRELLADIVNVEIEKTLSRTDWTRRPLPPMAIEYAATDVEHLLAMWEKLEQRLTEGNRLEWLYEDCARALVFDLEPALPAIYQRTKGSGRLRGNQMLAALALLDWREQRAKSADRPRRWIMKDDVLVALATLMPSTPKDLEAVSGLNPKTRSRHATTLLQLINQPQDHYKTYIPECTPSERPDTAQLKSLQNRVRKLAEKLGIEPEVIAAKRDLVATVLDLSPSHLSKGWRAEVLVDAE